MFAKVAVVLFACCAVALARPQDDSAPKQAPQKQVPKSQYKTPILEVPNHAIDFGQQFIDDSLNTVGEALNDAFDKTGQVANNVIDTFSEVGGRGLRDGATLIKGGLGIFAVIPKIGLGLLSKPQQQQQNNNKNSGL